MFTRKFRKFLKKEGNNFIRKPMINKMNSKTYSNSLKKSDKVVCYNCRRSGHIQAECPETSRVRPSKLKSKKAKAMICTWNDEEDEDNEEDDTSSDEEEQDSKLCLMPKGDEDEDDQVTSPFEDYLNSD